MLPSQRDAKKETCNYEKPKGANAGERTNNRECSAIALGEVGVIRHALNVEGVSDGGEPLPKGVGVSGLSRCGDVLRLRLRPGADVRLRPGISVRVFHIRRLAGAWCAFRRGRRSVERRIAVLRIRRVLGGGVALSGYRYARQRRYQNAHARRHSAGIRRGGRRRYTDALERTKVGGRVVEVTVILQVL